MRTTGYADVDAVLATLVPRLAAALGGRLLGLYLFGSLVTGDFDPRLSDIDLAAIVASSLTDAELDRLARMHAAIARAFPAWDDRVEVGYLALADVRPFDPEATIAVISPGEPFHARAAEHSWLFNLRVVRDRGVTLLGPDPRTLVEPIGDEQLRAALRARMREWRAWTDEEIPLMAAGAQAYVVLTMCRALHTFATGDWSSKRRAAAWAIGAEPARAPLIRRALAWRASPPDTAIDLAAAQAETLAFTRDITSRITAS